MVRLASLPTKYPMLVVGTQSHSRHVGPAKTSPQDSGLLLNSWSKELGLPRTGFHCAPTPKCLNRNAFLPDDLSYQDIWQQPFFLTVAYARGLQYWAEKLNLPDGSNFCPLVGSVIELQEMVKEHVFTDWGPSPRFREGWPKGYKLRAPNQPIQ